MKVPLCLILSTKVPVVYYISQQKGILFQIVLCSNSNIFGPLGMACCLDCSAPEKPLDLDRKLRFSRQYICQTFCKLECHFLALSDCVLDPQGGHLKINEHIVLSLLSALS